MNTIRMAAMTKLFSDVSPVNIKISLFLYWKSELQFTYSGIRCGMFHSKINLGFHNFNNKKDTCNDIFSRLALLSVKYDNFTINN